MTLPSPAALFALIIFGIVGLIAFRRGIKAAQWETTVIGLALMVYPYAVDQTWLLYVIGLALCGALVAVYRWRA